MEAAIRGLAVRHELREFVVLHSRILFYVSDVPAVVAMNLVQALFHLSIFGVSCLLMCELFFFECACW